MFSIILLYTFYWIKCFFFFANNDITIIDNGMLVFIITNYNDIVTCCQVETCYMVQLSAYLMIADNTDIIIHRVMLPIVTVTVR